MSEWLWREGQVEKIREVAPVALFWVVTMKPKNLDPSVQIGSFELTCSHGNLLLPHQLLLRSFKHDSGDSRATLAKAEVPMKWLAQEGASPPPPPLPPRPLPNSLSSEDKGQALIGAARACEEKDRVS